MTDDVAQALGKIADWAVREWIAPRLPDDPELHSAVAVLLRALATRLDGQVAPVAAPAAVPVAPPPPPPVSPPLPPPIPISQLPPLHIGSAYMPPSAPPYWEGERELDLMPLTTIADRCRVKGDACKLVARRVADSFDWDDAAEVDVSRRAQALPDCHLWMLTREPMVTAPKAWEDLAGAYATAADAAHMLRDWEQAPPPLAMRHASRVLGLAAEAQSVLLYAVTDVRDVKVDFDQIQIFAHIRSTARDRQVFIPKYLKREDKADPGSWSDVNKRIAEVWSQFKAFGERDKQRTKSLNSLKFKLGRLRDKPEESAGEWPRVLELIEEVVASGLPPSNAELRDMLLPVFEDIPDNPPPTPNVELVFREIDRYVDTRPEADPPVRVPRPSPDVAQVAELLRGREVVLIGGQNRPNHKAALMKAFGLTDVRWICTPEHTSFTVFEPDVAAPEVALVLLAIRWSSHDYDSVRTYCEQYGKPLVRLPGGYNANQVAHHILAQAGDRLRASLLAPAG